MWKREPSTPAEDNTIANLPSATPAPQPRAVDKTPANIGKSVNIKGELNGSEDLNIEGQVEGKIELRNHVLTIGQNGRVCAEIIAKAVIVQGQVIGNINASERITIRENGSVDGDIVAPRISIAEGAMFKGKIDMQNKPAETSVNLPPPASLQAKPAAEETVKKTNSTDKA